VPCQQGLKRGEHAVGAHRATLVGDVVEHAGVLPALDLIDGLPPERFVEQFKIRAALI